MRIKYLVLLAAGTVMGCASAPTTGTGATTSLAGVKHDANVLTREEIAGANVTNAFDAVQRLRPQYLRSHGSTSMAPSDAGYPSVYLNHQFYGDISTLKQLNIGAIREIHYYTPAQATNRFSIGSPSGAIEVITDVR